MTTVMIVTVWNGFYVLLFISFCFLVDYVFQLTSSEHFGKYVIVSPYWAYWR